MSDEKPTLGQLMRKAIEDFQALRRDPICYGHCGDLAWTVMEHDRVTHKQDCPHRTEPWCQTHPEMCPPECEPIIWTEWRARTGKAG